MENLKDLPYDPIKNHLPYGGAVNIYGEITWCVTKEEHDEMMARIDRIFAEDEADSN